MARFQRVTRPSRSSTTMPESRLSRMFSLYSLSPRSSSAFSLQAAVEPPVHDGGGRLGGQRLQDVDLLAVERVEPVLAADAEDGDHLALHPAGEEPARARGGQRRGARPAADSTSTGWPGRTAARGARSRPGSPAAPRRSGARPRARKGRKPPSGAGQEERHLAEAERRPDALEQPLARPLQVEVGIQVLGQPHQGLARAVALPVERAGRAPPGSGS